MTEISLLANSSNGHISPYREALLLYICTTHMPQISYRNKVNTNRGKPHAHTANHLPLIWLP